MKTINLFYYREVGESLSLRLLGFGLALTHVLTFHFWHNLHLFKQIQADNLQICWSFYQNCDSFNFFKEVDTQFLFIFYLILSSVCAFLFLFKRTTPSAFLIMFVITGIKALVFVQDYRFMGNYHYMPFWITATFLFSPQKKQSCALLIVLFYFCAGLLKYNVEWLSGSAMILPPLISGKVLEWATVFAILIESFFVFWLLSQHFWKRILSLFLLVSFHLFSWHIVGYFYPLIMFSLLLFLIPEIKSGIQLKTKKPLYLIFPAAFLLCQLIPLILFPNSSVSGEGRLLSLNMLDAKTVCRSEIVLKQGNSYTTLPLLLNNLGVRIACDPLVHIYQAKHYCKNLKLEKNDRISLHLASKQTTEDKGSYYLNLEDICNNPPEISFLGEIR